MSICATYPSPPLNLLCRAFNLEALITNAKLGAQLGVDYYNFPSKYGRTIQDAVNFAMNVKPGKEDVEELLPHVAAVAAAYAKEVLLVVAKVRTLVSSASLQNGWYPAFLIFRSNSNTQR